MASGSTDLLTLEDATRKAMIERLDPIYGGTQAWKDFFLESQAWSYGKKRDLQLQLLGGLAQEFSLNIESWDDFHSLKLSNKDDLRTFSPHNSDKSIAHQTSGSSGIPFSFYRDEILEPIDSAIFERAWSWVGRSNELVLRLVSGDPKWRYYDYFRNIVPKNYRTIDDGYADWVMEKKPKIIHGVAGAIRDLTDRVVKKGGEPHLKHTSLYLMSEDPTNHRPILSRYYGGVFMGYGNAECRTVASQCKLGTLHVNMETSVAESIDGELYVTNLFNKVMPFLRYKTGDKGRVVPQKTCECGITSDTIEGLEGKVIDYYHEQGMERPTGWWLVSPISHQYGDLVKAWRLELFPKTKMLRIYVVPKSDNIERLNEYLKWVEQNTGFKTELVKTNDLPDWRRKLLRVIDN